MPQVSPSWSGIECTAIRSVYVGLSNSERRIALRYSENMLLRQRDFCSVQAELFHPCGAYNETIMKAHRGAQAQRRQQASKSAHMLCRFLIYAVCDVCKSVRLRSQCAIIVSFQTQCTAYARRPTHQLLYMRYNFFCFSFMVLEFLAHTLHGKRVLPVWRRGVWLLKYSREKIYKIAKQFVVCVAQSVC